MMRGEQVVITRLGVAGGVVPEDGLFPDDDLLPGGRDAQGNPYRLTPVSVTSDGWFVSGFNGGGEVGAAEGDVDSLQIVVYNRSVVDVRATDDFTVRGQVWKVVGEIEPWVSPYSGFSGVAVTLGRAG